MCIIESLSHICCACVDSSSVCVSVLISLCLLCNARITPCWWSMPNASTVRAHIPRCVFVHAAPWPNSIRFAVFAERVSHTCLIYTPSTQVFHIGGGAGRESRQQAPEKTVRAAADDRLHSRLDADENSEPDAGAERTSDCCSARRTLQNQRRETSVGETLSWSARQRASRVWWQSRRPKADNTGSSSAHQRQGNAYTQVDIALVNWSRLARNWSWVARHRKKRCRKNDVTSADLREFVRSELEALSDGIDDFFPATCRVSSPIKSVGVWKTQRWDCQRFLKCWWLFALQETRWRAKVKARMNLLYHSLERARESGANRRQPNGCRTSWLQERPSQHVTSVNNAATGPVTLDVLERETCITRLGQMNTCSRIVRSSEPSWWSRELDNPMLLLSVPVCANTLFKRLLSQICDGPLSVHAHMFWQQISAITYLSPPALLRLMSKDGRIFRNDSSSGRHGKILTLPPVLSSRFWAQSVEWNPPGPARLCSCDWVSALSVQFDCTEAVRVRASQRSVWIVESLSHICCAWSDISSVGVSMFIPLCLLCNARITFCFKMQKGFISFLKYLWVFASHVGNKIVPSRWRVETWPAAWSSHGYLAAVCLFITHSTLTDNQQGTRINIHWWYILSCQAPYMEQLIWMKRSGEESPVSERTASSSDLNSFRHRRNCAGCFVW